MVEQHVDGISILVLRKPLLIIKGMSFLQINNSLHSFAFIHLLSQHILTQILSILANIFLYRFGSQKMKLQIPSKQEQQLSVAKETHVEHKTLHELLTLDPYAFPV